MLSQLFNSFNVNEMAISAVNVNDMAISVVQYVAYSHRLTYNCIKISLSQISHDAKIYET